MTEREPSQLASPGPNRTEQSKKLTTFLTKSKAEKVFGNDETKKEYIQKVSYDDFKNLLIRINGILRDKPLHGRSADGKNMVVASGIESTGTPHNDDKDILLQEMLERAKKLDNVDDIALLTATSINAVHPFLDGNGRTSRTMYFLLHDDYRGTKEDNQQLQELVSDDGRFKVDPSPGMLEEFVEVKMQTELGLNPPGISGATGIYELNHLSPDSRKKFDTVVEDISYKFLAIYKYLKESGKLQRKYVREVYEDNGMLEGRGIELTALAPDLTESDVQGISESYSTIKREAVQKMMDIITQPDEYQHPSGGTVKEWFEKEIVKEK